MSALKKEGNRLQVVFIGLGRPTTPKPKLSDWVVLKEASGATMYELVLSNLEGEAAPIKPSTVNHVRERIEKGLRKESFIRLKSLTGLPARTLSDILSIAPRTIARREVFKADESERILRVAVTFNKAIELFGSLQKAREWFVKPRQAFAGKSPLEFCSTEIGASEVNSLLGRIEYGVFS